MSRELEIVRVFSEQALIDSESYQRRYETRGGTPLEPGYYLVIQDERSDSPRYGAHTEYVGPYRNRYDAARELHSYEQR